MAKQVYQIRIKRWARTRENCGYRRGAQPHVVDGVLPDQRLCVEKWGDNVEPLQKHHAGDDGNPRGCWGPALGVGSQRFTSTAEQVHTTILPERHEPPRVPMHEPAAQHHLVAGSCTDQCWATSRFPAKSAEKILPLTLPPDAFIAAPMKNPASWFSPAR